MAVTVLGFEGVMLMAFVGVTAGMSVDMVPAFAAKSVRTVIVGGWNQPAPDDIRNQCDLGGVAGQYASHGRAFTIGCNTRSVHEWFGPYLIMPRLSKAECTEIHMKIACRRKKKQRTARD